MIANESLFFQKFGVTARDLQRYLGEALSTGGDYAELYFEYLTSTSISLGESIVKSASRGRDLGCGVRVLAGEHTGYAYTDDLAPEKILCAARTAALIARCPAQHSVQNLKERATQHLYEVSSPSADADMAAKLELVTCADRAARAYDPRIIEVQCTYVDELRQILVAASDGTYAMDVQPLARLLLGCIARSGVNSARGQFGGGGRMGIDYFRAQGLPAHYAQEAARQALIQLDAREAPAGEMEVVLGPGWPGILLHEAVGHGLEADYNRKGASAFAGLMGKRVASEKCTVVDNGTLPWRRGSINMDDEGSPSQNTVLIENGILTSYLSDKLSARLMKITDTGNGRRESYEHIPLPRMTNTYMLAGDDCPEDIIRSVKHGIYAVNFGGGQVDVTNGKFVFSMSEAYMIENGKVGAPLKNCSLIGNGPDALTKVSMVGNDLKLDEGLGTCGKDGQSVPVGVGMPTVKLDSMIVGGTG